MRHRFHFLGALILVAVCLAAICGCGGGGTLSGQTLPANNNIGANLPTRDPAPSFQVTVATDKATYKSGDKINITVSVTNVGSTMHSLAYPTTDMIVRWGYIVAQNGKILGYEYYPRSNIFFNTAVAMDQYAAGETKTFNYVFPYTLGGTSTPPGTLQPGVYQIYARQGDLTYDGTTAIRHTVPTPASDPVTITVTQ